MIIRQWQLIAWTYCVTFKCIQGRGVYMKTPTRSHAFIILSIFITLLFISSVVVAQQGRVQVPVPQVGRTPVPMPAPAPAPSLPCDAFYLDSASEAYGNGTDVSYAAALGAALVMCDADMPRAEQDEADEVSLFRVVR